MQTEKKGNAFTIGAKVFCSNSLKGVSHQTQLRGPLASEYQSTLLHGGHGGWGHGP